jgi:hypothetical protein
MFFFELGETLFFKGVLQIWACRTWFFDGFLWTNRGENVVLKRPSHDAEKHAISLRFIFGRAVDRDILDNIFDDRRSDLSFRDLQPDEIDAAARYNLKRPVVPAARAHVRRPLRNKKDSRHPSSMFIFTVCAARSIQKDVSR